MWGLRQWLWQAILPLGGVFLFLFPSDLYDAAWHCVGYAYGHVTTDPSSLGVASLQEILDEKGVDYSHVVEKSDLVRLVKEMDDVCRDHLPFKTHAAPDIVFRNGQEFDRRATEQLTELWLMLAVNDSYAERPGTLDTWSVVKRHVTRLGVNTGRLDCRKDPKYCKTVDVLGTRIFMVLPFEDKEKTVPGQKKVLRKHIHRYKGPFQKMPILHWFRKTLQLSVTNITDVLELSSKWMTFKGKSGPDFRAVFFTDQDTLPTSISMLGLQYTDIVKVGVIRERNGLLLKWMRHHNIGENFPQLLILTREGARYSYGRAAGECFSFCSLQWLFVMFTPFRSNHCGHSFLTCIAVLVMWAVKTRRWAGLAVYTILCTAVLAVWWGHAIRGKSLALIALSSTQITTDSALHRGLLLYTQYPSLLVLCLLLLCFALDQLAHFSTLDQLTSRVCGDLLAWWINVEDPVTPNVPEQRAWRYQQRVAASDDDSQGDVAVQGDEETFMLMIGEGPAGHVIRINIRLLNHLLSNEGRDIVFSWPDPGFIDRLPTWEHPGAKIPHTTTGDVDADGDGGKALTADTNTGVPDTEPDGGNTDQPARADDGVDSSNEPCKDSGDRPVSGTIKPPDGANVGSNRSEELSTAAAREESVTCVICLQEFQPGEKICGLPCTHVYHHSCIRTWLTGDGRTCPLCRASPVTP